MERKPMLKKNGHQSSKEIPKQIESNIQAQSNVSSNKKDSNLKHRTYVKYFQNHPFTSAHAEHSSSYSIHRNGNSQSRISRGDISNYRDYSRSYGGRDQIEYVPTQHVVALQQRLRNIHENYKRLIEEQKKKNEDKGQVIMSLLQEMQVMHNQKMEGIRKMIEDSENQKRQVGFVDDRMIQIKGNIDELINQSSTLKSKNEELEKKISEKTKINQQKQNELQQLNEELLEVRTQLEQFELNNLKNNKINRQIMDIFSTASTISS